MNLRHHSQAQEQDEKNCCWESGIRFVEKKRQRRIKKVVVFVVMIIAAAMAGGITGAEYTKRNTSIDKQTESLMLRSDNNGPGIHEIIQSVGPSVVGIVSSTPDKLGSGVIFNMEGYIVTSYNIVSGMDHIGVILPDIGGKPIDAELIGADLKSDIAVLKINMHNLTAAEFDGTSDSVVGDIAVSIENPLGQEISGSAMVGYISSVKKQLNIDDDSYDIIELDSALSCDSAGAAVCSMSGKVIGICLSNYTTDKAKSYGISINSISKIVEEIVSGDRSPSPYIGIQHIYMGEDLAEAYKVPQGEMITDVREGSSSKKSGVAKNDIITKANGEPIRAKSDFSHIVSKLKAGETLMLTIWRSGNEINIPVIVENSIK